jgi:hypothetical protein
MVEAAIDILPRVMLQEGASPLVSAQHIYCLAPGPKCLRLQADGD